jgi:hypothetical protein
MSGTLICGKDPVGNTIVPIAVNANGELEMTAEIDSSGLATSDNQDTMITDLAQIATNTSRLAPLLNRTEAIPVQIMVGSGGANYDALRANGQDLMVMVDDMNPDVAINSGLSTAVLQTAGNAILTDGSQKAKCMGNFTGTDVQIKVDANGVVETSGGGGGSADSTAANQVLQLAQETIIAGDTTSIDGKIVACNTGAVVISSSALPTGAALESSLSSLNGKVTACNTGAVVVASGAITETNSGAIATDLAAIEVLQTTIAGDTTSIDGKITACNTGAVVISSSALPSGATTESSLTTMSAKLPASLGQKANSGSLSTCRSTTAGAYDLSGRTTIATASTSTKLLCDSDGRLQVDVVGGAGGDSTAANQVLQLAQETIIAGSHYTDNQSFGGSDTGVLVMGRDGSNLAQPIHITNNGDVEVEIADFVKGQAAMASSFPVVLASNQAAIPVTIAALPLPSGGATAALQTTQETTLDAIEVLVTAGNAILSTIDTDTGAMVVDLAAIEISNAAIKVATEASAVDLAALEVLSTAANVDLAAIEVLQTTIAGDTSSLDAKITACNTGAVVLAAGSASIGKLGANSGVDIGDVDVTSLPAKVNSDTTLWSVNTAITNGATLTSAVIDKNGAYRLSAAIAVDANGGSGYSIQAQGSADNSTYFDVGMPQMLTNPSLSKSIEFDTSFRYVKVKITNSVGSDRQINYSVASHANGL